MPFAGECLPLAGFRPNARSLGAGEAAVRLSVRPFPLVPGSLVSTSHGCTGFSKNIGMGVCDRWAEENDRFSPVLLCTARRGSHPTVRVRASSSGRPALLVVEEM